MKNHTRVLVGIAGLALLAGPSLGQVVRSSKPVEPPVAGPGAPVVEGPAPKMVFQTTAVDFGRILDDKVTPYQEVPFTNEGEGTLIIKDLRASCGCTVGKLEKREYAPGESGTIQVQFKPQGKSNQVRQTVTITTNDPAFTNYEAQINVTAYVMPIVRTDPAMINLGILRKGEFVSNIFSVIGLYEDFKVVGVEVIGGTGITAEVLGRERISADEGREGWKVEVEVLSDGSAKPGVIRGHIRVHTNDPRRESVSVNLSGQVLGDIAVSEPQIRFGSLDMGATFEHTIRIESRSGTPFKILGFKDTSNLEDDIEWIVTPLGDTEDHSIYNVKMRMQMPDRPGMVRGTTIMTTDMKDEQRIQLMFFGLIKPPAPEVDPDQKNRIAPGKDDASKPGTDANEGGGK
jgi:Protein of unknown function (DUF1573)